MVKYDKYDNVYGHFELKLYKTGGCFKQKLTKTDVVLFLLLFNTIVP